MTYSHGCCCIPISGGTPVVPPGGRDGVCLDGYAYAQDDTAFGTALVKQFTGKNLTIPPGGAPGLYRFAISYIGTCQLFNNGFRLNVDLDGADIFSQTQHESGNRNGVDEVPWGRMSCLVDLDDGPHLFSIWIGSNAGPPFAVTAWVYETVMELWRVA